MSTLPSTRALQVFEAAARLGSFSAAADELSLTQSAVSHQIRELETVVGTPLFDREGRAVVLNQRGRAYLGYARDALQAIRRGHHAVSRELGERTLTVSVSPNFASKWLVPRLGGFLTQHPDIDLRISANMRHIDFGRDDVDIAVRHGTGDWPELSVEKLSDEVIFPVASPMLKGIRKISAVADLLRFTLLHDQEPARWGEWLASAGVTGVDYPESPVFDQTAHVIDAALAGQGVALARSELVSLDLESGRLFTPVDHQIAAPFSYWVVWPTDTAKTATIDIFRRWVLAQTAARS